MYHVSPRDNERFHLRLLLLHLCGATSYHDLRTVAGQEADTLPVACRLRNLLDDDEWDNCFGEAGGFQMPLKPSAYFVILQTPSAVAWSQIGDDEGFFQGP